MPEEHGLDLPLGPELEGLRHRFHRVRVPADEKTAEEDPLDAESLGVEVRDLYMRGRRKSDMEVRAGRVRRRGEEAARTACC